MERRIFKTLINNSEGRYGNSEYVVGRISGIQLAMCETGVEQDVQQSFVIANYDKGTYLLITNCLPEQYEAFCEVVEKHYPNLCEFNCQVP